MSVRKPIVVVGSMNTDLVAVTQRIPAVGETLIASDFQIHPGGKGANQAVGVARLGYPVCLIGRLGNDAFGRELHYHLQNSGVDTSGVAISEGVSGTAVIVVSERGENCIVVAPGANYKVTPEDLDANIDTLRGAGMVLAQLEIPLETVEHLGRICAREGLPLILDPAPAMNLPPGIFQDIAWFTPNQTEAAFYLGAKQDDSSRSVPEEIAQTLLARGCRGVVLKMGEEGAYLSSPDEIGTFVPAFKVRAVDTTAAGDAFNAGFATALMLGQSSLQSAAFASAVAAISVTRTGAQPSMPTRAEVQDFMKANRIQCGQVILA